ncbi:MAG: hypothetical protein RL071_472 [Pseudomonadota bacterium]
MSTPDFERARVEALIARALQLMSGPLRGLAAQHPEYEPWHLRSLLFGAVRQLLGPPALDVVSPWFGPVSAERLPAVASAIGALGPAGLLADGADRSAFPVVNPGVWSSEPTITHPMQPNARLKLRGTKRTDPAQAMSAALRQLDRLTRPGPGGEVERLERLCLALWRNQRELCAKVGGPFGEHLPADPQLPDHAAWSTSRIAAAVAGVGHRGDEGEPVLARVTVHGVQPYIAESRKARDLWTACMVFGELTWAAMGPIIEACGPEAILYPDLRGNALMDQLLLTREGEEWPAALLPDGVRASGAGTRAVPVPNTFAALLPAVVPTRAGPVTAAELLERCATAAADRWAKMADNAALPVLKGRLGDGAWQQIYARSTKQAPAVSWTALPWEHALKGLGERPDDLQALPGWREGLTPATRPLHEQRDAPLRALAKPEAWRAHDALFFAAWGADPSALCAERGFDYPLQHARLLALHEATGRARWAPPAPPEPGEKCTMTGRHEALHNGANGPGLSAARQAAQRLWAEHGKDDDGTVSERLGGPAAMKRALADSGHRDGLSQRWQGVGNPQGQADGAPFASTAGVAATPWLRALWELVESMRLPPYALPADVVAVGRGPDLEGRISRLTTTASDLFKDELSASIHPWALHALSKGGGDPALRSLVGIEAQRWSVEAQSALADQTAGDDRSLRIRDYINNDLCPFFAELRAWAGALGPAANSKAGRSALAASIALAAAGPSTQVAVLAMDGDGISALVGGEPGALRARWRDTLHPDVVQAIEGDPHPSQATTAARGLLDQGRAMSPALHGTLTRALADLTDRIAPWVIEVEFNGRLIYAGGDDLLAMLPAAEALPAAARIQQLFSAAWLIDTKPSASAWDRRQQITPSEARQRFAVLDHARLGGEPLVLHGQQVPVEDHCCPQSPGAGEDSGSLLLTLEMQVLPMMGRANSLSAGIAYGHFKEPLRELIAVARDNLELGAKGATKRRAKLAVDHPGLGTMGHLGVSRLTGGDKATAVLPWGTASGSPALASAPEVAQRLGELQQGIAEGTVASRLPYVLRTRLRLILAATDGPHARVELIEGALQAEGLSGPLLGAARWLICQADRAAHPEATDLAGRSSRSGGDTKVEDQPVEELDAAVDALLAPLLIARHLAGAGGAA